MNVLALLFLAFGAFVELSPRLSVRVVDRLLLPLAGIEVIIAEGARCSSAGELIIRGAQKGLTDRDGLVEFPVTSGRAYTVVAGGSGSGFARVTQCVALSGMAAGNDTTKRDTAYVQLRLPFDADNSVHLYQPSSATSSKSSDELKVVGTYLDSAKREYGVIESVDGDGLELNCPDGRIIFFERKSAVLFQGPEGSLTFTTRDGRAIGFRFVPTILNARSRRISSGGREQF